MDLREQFKHETELDPYVFIDKDNEYMLWLETYVNEIVEKLTPVYNMVGFIVDNDISISGTHGRMTMFFSELEKAKKVLLDLEVENRDIRQS